MTNQTNSSHPTGANDLRVRRGSAELRNRARRRVRVLTATVAAGSLASVGVLTFLIAPAAVQTDAMVVGATGTTSSDPTTATATTSATAATTSATAATTSATAATASEATATATAATVTATKAATVATSGGS